MTVAVVEEASRPVGASVGNIWRDGHAVITGGNEDKELTHTYISKHTHSRMRRRTLPSSKDNAKMTLSLVDVWGHK